MPPYCLNCPASRFVQPIDDIDFRYCYQLLSGLGKLFDTFLFSLTLHPLHFISIYDIYFFLIPLAISFLFILLTHQYFPFISSFILPLLI